MRSEQIGVGVLLCCTDGQVAHCVALSLIRMGEGLYSEAAGTLPQPPAPVQVQVRVLVPDEGVPVGLPASWLVVRLWQPKDKPSVHGVPAGGRAWSAVVPMIAHSPAEAAQVVHRLVLMRCPPMPGGACGRGEAVAPKEERPRR